jgi:hypothetical protein
MNDDLVTPENLSKELLRSIYDQAFLETSLDSEGDLRVHDGIRCFVFPRDDRVRLFCMFKFDAANATPEKRLEMVNRVNCEYIMVRAASGANDSLVFDHDIIVKGGVTKAQIVHATKRFLSIPLQAIGEYGKGLVL